MKFTLETNGYRVHEASSITQSRSICAGEIVNLVIVQCCENADAGTKIISAMKAIKPWVPVMKLCYTKDLGELAHPADAAIDITSLLSRELLDRVKIMTIMKRGPRKKPRK